MKRKEYLNVAEEAFCKWIEERGYAPMKRGWPDFFCRNAEGDIIAVEVKPRPGNPLTLEQQFVMTTLHEHGIKSYRWDPIHQHLASIDRIPHKTGRNRNMAIGDLSGSASTPSPTERA